jgi:hypothetical protein
MRLGAYHPGTDASVIQHSDIPHSPSIGHILFKYANDWRFHFGGVVFTLSSFIKVWGMDGVPWVIAIATMYTAQWLTLEILILTAVNTMPEPKDADNAAIVLLSPRYRLAAVELKTETEHDIILWLFGTLGYMTHVAVLTVFPLD